MSNPTCHKCQGPAVAIEKKAKFSAAGLLGFFMIILALPVMLFHLVAGLVIIVVAILIGTLGHPKVTWLKCTVCGAERKL